MKYVLYPVILVAEREHVRCQLCVHNVHVCVICMVRFFCFVKSECVSCGNTLFYQVVAGTLVRLTLELGYTTCRKGEDSDISNCQLKEDSVMSVKVHILSSHDFLDG